MPLPFLTADRDAEELAPAAGAAAPPARDEDLARWRRPYRPGPWRVGVTALLLLLASYVLFAAMIIAVAGSLPGAGICVAVAVLVITLAVRLVRAGVWVSEHGLRHVGLLSAKTVPWAEVTAVRTAQQPVRWLGLPRTVQGQAVVVERAGGSPLPTLVTDHGADFLGRPQAFAMACDAVEGWAADFRR
ncbi:hypothetical protein [Streptomyces aureoversilis]|uniref:PH domain-containing protein n=1 Tax=Streptomyces aureoversilis TaxID=67277 RepID=A0ABW0AAN9_9ACTN